VRLHEELKTPTSTEKSKLLADKAEIEKARDAMLGERDASRAEFERLKHQVADQERTNGEMRGSVDKIAKSIDDVMAKSNALSGRARQGRRRPSATPRRPATRPSPPAPRPRARPATSRRSCTPPRAAIADLEKTSTSLKKESTS
jgi:hypothetical protein